MQADTQEKAKIGPVCEVHLLLLFQLAQSSAEWVGWQEVICVTWISFSLYLLPHILLSARPPRHSLAYPPPALRNRITPPRGI